MNIVEFLDAENDLLWILLMKDVFLVFFQTAFFLYNDSPKNTRMLSETSNT